MAFRRYRMLLLGILPFLFVLSSACVSRNTYNQVQAQLSQSEQEKSRLAGEVTRLSSESSDLKSQISKVDSESKDLKSQLSSLNSQVLTLKADLNRQADTAQGLRRQLEETLTAKNSLELEAKDLRSQLDGAIRTTADLNKKIEALNSQVKTLETMVPRFTQPPAGWKKYQNDEWGYSVQIPSNWEVFDFGEKDDVAMWEPGLVSSLYIQSFLTGPQKSLDLYTDLVKNPVQRQELSRSQIVLPGGIPSTVVLFKTTIGGVNKQGIYLTALTESRFYYLRLLTSESEWAKKRAQLEQIVLNFVLF